MKVLTDNDILSYFNNNLLKDLLINKFIPSLSLGLITYLKDASKIVPPRIAQSSNNKDSDTTHLFMPCISPNEVGIKVISGGPSNNAKGLGFTGCVLVINEISGEVEALINATNLTAFRTALASFLGIYTVVKTQDLLPAITVFGVGLQAYWHVRLALTLYPQEIKTVNIVNRTLKNAEKLVDRLSKEFKNIEFNAFSYKETSQLESIKLQCLNSSLIFGCSPSTEPIILQEYINPNPKYVKFISLIGSYKPHMIELDLKVIRGLKDNGIKILVDSKEHCLHEAGELIQGEVNEDGLVEIAELYEKDVAQSTVDKNNLTVQKIVGLSIMDLNIGKYIVDNSGDEGVVIDNF